MGDYGSAIAEYNTAIRISPQYLYPYRSRAEAYEARGDLAAALADYRVALSLDPGKQQIGGKEAAEGIARVEQKLAAADKSKVAAVEPKPREPRPRPQRPKSPRSGAASRSSSATASDANALRSPIRRTTPPISR